MSHLLFQLIDLDFWTSGSEQKFTETLICDRGTVTMDPVLKKENIVEKVACCAARNCEKVVPRALTAWAYARHYNEKLLQPLVMFTVCELNTEGLLWCLCLLINSLSVLLCGTHLRLAPLDVLRRGQRRRLSSAALFHMS